MAAASHAALASAITRSLDALESPAPLPARLKAFEKASNALGAAAMNDSPRDYFEAFEDLGRAAGALAQGGGGDCFERALGVLGGELFAPPESRTVAALEARKDCECARSLLKGLSEAVSEEWRARCDLLRAALGEGRVSALRVSSALLRREEGGSFVSAPPSEGRGREEAVGEAASRLELGGTWTAHARRRNPLIRSAVEEVGAVASRLRARARELGAAE